MAAGRLEGCGRGGIRTGRIQRAGEHLAEAIRISTEIGDSAEGWPIASRTSPWPCRSARRRRRSRGGASRAILALLGISGLAITDIADQADPGCAYDFRLSHCPHPGRSGCARHGTSPSRRRAGCPAVPRRRRRVRVGRHERRPSSGRQPWYQAEQPRTAGTVDLVADGLTDKQIAEKLFISVRTVHTHLDRIRQKTGARRRAELTRLAVRT